jgi:hypothetical protein
VPRFDRLTFLHFFKCLPWGRTRWRGPSNTRGAAGTGRGPRPPARRAIFCDRRRGYAAALAARHLHPNERTTQTLRTPHIRSNPTPPPRGQVITCNASIPNGAPPQLVTSGVTEFPWGVTSVTCVATDAAGLVSRAVSFPVWLECGSGYSWRGGECKSEPLTGRAGATCTPLLKSVPPFPPTSRLPPTPPPCQTTTSAS